MISPAISIISNLTRGQITTFSIVDIEGIENAVRAKLSGRCRRVSLLAGEQQEVSTIWTI